MPRVRIAPRQFAAEKPKTSCALFVAFAYRPGKLVRYTPSNAISGVSNNRHSYLGHLSSVPAGGAVRQLGSHDSNGERY